MRVELTDIHKAFGTVRANDGISLVAEAGTIRGLLGENGAGKSTLMKVLSGFTVPERGQIRLDGAPVRIGSPAEAIRHGIGMLHQDPLDFPSLNVLDNFILGSPGSWLPDRRRARRALSVLADRFAFTLHPDATCDSLTVGERQQLEILRLLWLGAQVLILDEPTTAISASQRTRLFAALRAMAVEGKVVFFVSHKLEEVQALCDAVTILRHGKVAGEASPPGETSHLVALMFGRNPPPLPGAGGAGAGTVPAAEGAPVPVLELADVAPYDAGLRMAGVTLQVRRGESIGLAGLEGSGQRQFLRACAGLVRANGRITVAKQEMTGRPYAEFRDVGVAYVPAGRLDEALIPGLTLAEHAALADRRSGVLVDWPAASRSASRRIRAFAIRGTPRTEVQELSGGNQQRAILSLLPDQLRVLLIEHPTRGLDVESAHEVWARLLERRSRGTAIIFSSSDLDELREHSDRILVFFEGRVSAPLDARRSTVAHLGELIGGAGF
jgi:general nucleoside transport system ATP-binding protein